MFEKELFLISEHIEENMNSNLKSKTEFKFDNTMSIYSGYSGILFFYLNMYKCFNKTGHYVLVKNIADFIVKNYKKDKHLTNSFHTGYLGVAYVLFVTYDSLKIKSYYDDAKYIVEDYLKRKFKSSTVDFLNGTAGEIIGLLKVSEYFNETNFTEQLNLKINELFESVFFTEHGIVFENSYTFQKPLCGISHGSSGYAWVCFLLSKIIDNQYLFFVKDALKYEDSNYNKKLQEWPDFRSPDSDIIKRGDLKNLPRPESMKLNETKHPNLWCHGSSGIILARIAINEYLNDKSYEKLIDSTLLKNEKIVLNNLSNSFNLCHGILGNSEVFLRVNRSKLKNLKIDSKKIFVKNIENYLGHKHSIFNNSSITDYSLFTGLTGVGYYILRNGRDKKVESILLPDINKWSKVDFDINQLVKTESLLYNTLCKRFPLTFKSINNKTTLLEIIQKTLKEYDFKSNFLNFFAKSIYNSFADKREIMVNFKHELKIYLFMQKNLNHSAWLYEKNYNISTTNSVNWTDNDTIISLTDKMLVLSKTIKPNITTINNKVINLYYLSDFGLNEQEIDVFTFKIICKIKKVKVIKMQSLYSYAESLFVNNTPYEDITEFTKKLITGLSTLGLIYIHNELK
jgi:hypothetical protein